MLKQTRINLLLLKQIIFRAKKAKYLTDQAKIVQYTHYSVLTKKKNSAS